jgi:CHAD domain-containing protein
MTTLVADDRTGLVKVGDKPGVLPDDTMSEAGRKILAFHFARMLTHEPGVRAGLEPKEVHDMRVAIRRMRSAIPVFEPYFVGKSLKRAGRALRRLGRTLGPVRDLDVMAIKTRKYAEKLDDQTQAGLQGLLKTWEREQKAARAEFIDLLDSDVLEQFLLHFAYFVNTPGLNAVRLAPSTDDPQPLLVRHVVPRVLYEKYEAVRAYEPILGEASFDALHALRIRAKELRYALEAFEEVLGPSAKEVIVAIKALQEFIGEIQDARVAADHLHAYLSRHDDRSQTTAVLAYMTARQAERDRKRAEVGGHWADFNRPEVRRALAAAIADL